MSRTMRFKPAWLLAAFAAASLPSCFGEGGPGSSANDVGTVDLALDVGTTAVIDTVSYVVTGPASYSTSGSIDVGRSSTLSATLSPIPQGTGFTIALSAVARGGGTTCAGSAPFDVATNQTTPVNVHLTCTEAPRSGSILIDGMLNICPTVNGIAGLPAQSAVGGTYPLQPLAQDIDQAPSPLTYQWTTTHGSLSDPAAAKPVFTCSSLGVATVTLTVSDGDISPGCAGVVRRSTECVIGGGGDAGAGGASSAGGATGTGGTSSTGGITSTGGIAGTGGDPGTGGIAGTGGAGTGGTPVTSKYVLMTGYDAALPTTGLAGTTGTAVPRTVGILDAAGTLNAQTAGIDVRAVHGRSERPRDRISQHRLPRCGPRSKPLTFQPST